MEFSAKSQNVQSPSDHKAYALELHLKPFKDRPDVNAAAWGVILQKAICNSSAGQTADQLLGDVIHIGRNCLNETAAVWIFNSLEIDSWEQ